MYVDEKRQGEVTADPFKRSTLVAWLEPHDSTKTYCYIDIRACLMCQYFAAHGYQDIEMTGRGFFSRGNKFTPLPPHFDDIAAGCYRDLKDGPRWTFGAALKRARALL
jgi:hypothetical protein